MTTISFAKREITYLLIALNSYHKQLQASVGEEMGDEYDDLLMAEHLMRRIKESEAADAGN
jgi:hypothetical protein